MTGGRVLSTQLSNSHYIKCLTFVLELNQGIQTCRWLDKSYIYHSALLVTLIVTTTPIENIVLVRYVLPCYFLVTVYPKKYSHGFVVLCFVVVTQSFIMNSHEVFIHIHQGCFAGTGAIVRLPQCQWSKPDRYGKISQWMTTTKHSRAKTVCIFLGIYCT